MRSDLFQYAVLGIFGVLAVAGTIFFATNDPESDSVLVSPVTMWGPYDRTVFESIIKSVNQEVGGLSKVTYVEKSRAVLYSDLIEQLAAGGGPDIVVMDDDRLLAFINKVYPLGEDTLPQKVFREQYIQGAEIFMMGATTYALPYAVDPLVMYWNRDIFSSAGVTVVPKYWDEFLQIVPRLTTIKDGSTITQSAIAFGEYDNVLHAKDIVSMLILQAGSPIVTWGQSGYSPALVGAKQGAGSEAAVRFFTDFSNPTKKVYSWNRSFDRSREQFVAGRLATYFGYVSEAELIRETNPNLNFDIATVPQARSGARITYGAFSGLAVMRNSRDPSRSLAVIRSLASAQGIAALGSATRLPPVRRDLLSRPPNDSFGATSYDSAIIATSWLEPSSTIADQIFRRLINDVLGGKAGVSEAISNASTELEAQAAAINTRFQ